MMTDAEREERHERIRHHKAMSEWRGPRPLAQVVRSNTCPNRVLAAQHYRPDGSCMCIPPFDDALEPHIVRGEN